MQVTQYILDKSSLFYTANGRWCDIAWGTNKASPVASVINVKMFVHKVSKNM